MASIQAYKGGYRAFLCVKGVRETATFRTQREAKSWAASRETELRADSQRPAGERTTLGQVMQRYSEEVSPTKRGVRWEQIRIAAFLREPGFPAALPVGQITPEILAAWRDARLKLVSPGTVLRELGLVSAILTHARREWRMIDVNPVADVRRPREPDHREVLITRAQIKAVLRAMKYHPAQPVRTVGQSVAVAFLLALRTGMRAGELTGMTWGHVFPSHVHLPVTKTKRRDVPLPRKSVRLIEKMRGFDPDSVFGLTPATLDAMFRKYRRRAGLDGFTFHDARHTAATWLVKSGKVDVLTLCKIFGWSNPKMAMTYFNPTAADIAAQIE